MYYQIKRRIFNMSETTGLTISIPLDKVDVGNLTNLLDAKGTLIKKALGIAELPIIIEEEVISFPWFDEMPAAEECTAYTAFIAALCQMSIKQKRISAAEKPTGDRKSTRLNSSHANISYAVFC